MMSADASSLLPPPERGRTASEARRVGVRERQQQPQYNRTKTKTFRARVTEVRFWNNDVTKNINGILEKIKEAADELRRLGRTPTRRWHADLPLPGGGEK
jgi:hypothetical protein